VTSQRLSGTGSSNSQSSCARCMPNLLPTGHGRILKFFEDLHKQNTQAGWGIQLCNNPGPAINWLHLKLVKDRLNTKPFEHLHFSQDLLSTELHRFVEVCQGGIQCKSDTLSLPKTSNSFRYFRNMSCHKTQLATNSTEDYMLQAGTLYPPPLWLCWRYILRYFE
jgi:hypothetical protein